MSYTNNTPNYGLPQYVADDKPTYLGDFNKAMLDIDTIMKTIDNKAIASESASNSANANATQALESATSASNTASQAQTTADNALTIAQNAQTSASSATTTANSANATATQAQTTANSANQTAQTANSNAQVALENSQKLNINTFKKFSSNEVFVGDSLTNVNSPNIYLATNKSKDVFKFYGNLYAGASKTGSLECYVNTELRPSEEITIASAGFINNGNGEINPISLKIGIDGKLTFSAWNGNNTGMVQFFIFPCIYLLTNFGDEDVGIPNE